MRHASLQRARRLLLAAATGVFLGMLAVTALVTENALHVRTVPPSPEAADSIARQTDSIWEPVRMAARDGAVLQAWCFTARMPNGSAVILLHGVGDTRAGMMGYARFLLSRGFTVLAPDSRAHGASGGSLVTYGVREAADVRGWSDWLLGNKRVQRLYGIGESLGAAILLESLSREPHFRAVVAECPFATFEEISFDRMAQVTGWPRPALWPVVHLGFLYASLRYGIDLRQASPARSVRTTNIPILLIHGTRDDNIPVRHSQELNALNPAATSLWLVPGASHMASLSADPEKYARTVAEWFAAHP